MNNKEHKDLETLAQEYKLKLKQIDDMKSKVHREQAVISDFEFNFYTEARECRRLAEEYASLNSQDFGAAVLVSRMNDALSEINRELAQAEEELSLRKKQLSCLEDETRLFFEKEWRRPKAKEEADTHEN